MKRYCFFALCVLLICSVFFSCAKKEKIIAKIGDQRITTEQFNKKFESAVGTKYDSPEQELAMRKNFLDRMIEEKLLVTAAYEQKLDTATDINQMLESQKMDLLVKQLYTIEVLDKATISENELKDYYETLGHEIQIKHILLNDKSQAEKLYDRLKKGEEFEKLASQYSGDKSTKDKGGDLGFVFNSKVGDISKPIETFYGWHIIKIEDKRENEQKPFEQVKDGLKANLQRARQQEIGYKYIEEFKKKINFEIVSDTKEKLLAPLAQEESGDSVSPPIAIWDPTKVTPEEQELVLVKYKGGEYKVSDFIEEFNKLPPMRKPRINDSNTLELWVWQLFLPSFLYQEAKDRGLDKTEGYQQEEEELKEQKLAENMRYGVLFKDIDASEEEIKEFYEKNKEMYVKDAEVKVREILLKTKAEAQDLLDRIKAGEDFSKLAEKMTIRETAKATGGDLGYIKKTRYPELFDYAMKLKKGDLGGPLFVQDFKYGKGWSIIEILDKKGGEQQSLDEVKALVANRIKGEKKMKTFEDFLSEMKEKLNVEIYEDVLESTLVTKPKG